jgi:DNA-binding CsgD family transcriptional regulator
MSVTIASAAVRAEAVEVARAVEDPGPFVRDYIQRHDHESSDRGDGGGVDIIIESPEAERIRAGLRAQSAADGRARQTFGLADYQNPAGIDAIERLFEFRLRTGSPSIGLSFRPWRDGVHHHPTAAWATEVTFDGKVRVVVRYRIADKADSDEVEVALEEVWRLAKEVTITDIRAAGADAAWFIAASDVTADETRYTVAVEDLRGLGRAVWNRLLTDLFKGVRGAVRHQPQAHERATSARTELARSGHTLAAISLVERLAIADYLTAPKPDSGPPPTLWIVCAQRLGGTNGRASGEDFPIQVLAVSPKWRDEDKSRLSKLATRLLGALSQEAWGASRQGTLKAKQWRLSPEVAMERDDEYATPGERDESRRRSSKTGWISDPTGDQAGRNVLWETANLTPRQRSIVELALVGATHAEIADRLEVARSTISNTLSTVRKKIGLVVDHFA